MKSATHHYATSKLSKREIQILELISYEYTSQEIAKQLYISVTTVESHRSNIMKKLQSKNVAGMVRRGFESGLLMLDKFQVNSIKMVS